MPKIVYTQEMIDFLRNRVDEMSFKVMTDAFNAHFNLHKTVSQVKSLCTYNNIYRKTFYTQDMLIFLKEKIKELPFDELAKSFNKNFGTCKSISAIKQACFVYGIKRRFLFTDEMINFLQKNRKSKSLNEIRIIFNNEFNLNTSLDTIARVCARHKISTRKKLTDEMIEFLKNNVSGNSFDELTQKFNTNFGTHKTVINIMTACKIRGIKNRRGTKPIGTEKISEGIVFVKVAHPDKWRMKHHLLWEQKNGPIPKECCIIFADGDKTNFNEDNLIKVSRAENFRLTLHKLRFFDPEYTKAGLNIVKIWIKAEERQKEIDDEKSEKENQPEEA